MGRSQKWPDLRSPISKIQDIRFVGTDDLIIFRKFHNFPWNIVAVARWEIYFVVGSLDLTWWPDLTWPWAEIFTKVAEKIGGKVGENPAALRAAVFSLSSKNLRGGRSNAPPAGRGLTWPGDLTWHDPGPKFWDNVWKRWMSSYTKRGGAARRRFCVICKKPEGGGGRKSTPPGVRVLTLARGGGGGLMQPPSMSFSELHAKPFGVSCWNFL